MPSVNGFAKISNHKKTYSGTESCSNQRIRARGGLSDFARRAEQRSASYQRTTANIAREDHLADRRAIGEVLAKAKKEKMMEDNARAFAAAAQAASLTKKMTTGVLTALLAAVTWLAVACSPGSGGGGAVPIPTRPPVTTTSLPAQGSTTNARYISATLTTKPYATATVYIDSWSDQTNSYAISTTPVAQQKAGADGVIYFTETRGAEKKTGADLGSETGKGARVSFATSTSCTSSGGCIDLGAVDGKKRVRIEVVDEAGNTNSLVQEFTVNTQPPQVEVVSVNPKLAKAGTVTVQLRCNQPLRNVLSDPNNPTSPLVPDISLTANGVKASLISGPEADANGKYLYTLQAQVAADSVQGAATLVITAVNAFGSGTLNQITVNNGNVLSIDTVAPHVSNLAVTPSIVGANRTVSIAFDASEALLSDPIVKVNGSAAQLGTKNGNSYVFTYTVAAASNNGPAMISITTNDLASNQKLELMSDKLTIDTSLPPIIIDGANATTTQPIPNQPPNNGGTQQPNQISYTNQATLGAEAPLSQTNTAPLPAPFDQFTPRSGANPTTGEVEIILGLPVMSNGPSYKGPVDPDNAHAIYIDNDAGKVLAVVIKGIDPASGQPIVHWYVADLVKQSSRLIEFQAERVSLGINQAGDEIFALVPRGKITVRKPKSETIAA